MTGSSHRDYATSETFTSADDLSSDDSSRRVAAEIARIRRIKADAERTEHEAPRATAKSAEPTRQPVDRRLARNKITAPSTTTTDAYVLLVDDSGSNIRIAQALQRASGYMHAVMSAIMRDAGLAIQFFSDHCDGPFMIQEVDWTSPGENGACILQASIDTLHNPGGGDEPEAIECALHIASDYQFGPIPKERRHLILITDQVAHGMGYSGRDDGCPVQRNWGDSLKRVHETYGTFEVITTGEDQKVFDLQKQFIIPERRRFDLLNMTTG